MHPLWREVCRSQQFQPFGAVKKVRRRHINIGEVSAALAAEEELGFSQPDSFYIHLQDSQVSLACLVKGRSSSSHINKQLRKSIPHHVGNNIRPFYGYVRSKENPADDPTRGVEIRPPVSSVPSWLKDLCGGSFQKFDEFPNTSGLNILHMSGLPDESELWPDAALDLRNSKQVRRDRVAKAVCPPTFEDSFAQKTPAAIASVVSCGGSVPSSSSSERVHHVGGTALLGPGQSSTVGGSDGNSAGSEAIAVDRSRFELPSWGQDLLEHFPRGQFVFSNTFGSLDEALSAGPGVLDLFSGSRGVARAMVKLARTWCLTFDTKHSPAEDLLDAQLQTTLRRSLISGAFIAMGAGPVCASFSTAITPPWRTTQFPAGVPGLNVVQQAKINSGQEQLRFVLDLVEICLGCGVHFWVENPDSSWFWRQRDDLSWDRLMSDGRIGDFRLDQCRLGTAWRKRTKIRTSTHLAGQTLFCRCTVPHVKLRGRCRERKMSFTKLAEHYPRRLNYFIAGALAIDTGLLPHRRSLDVSGCARCLGLRIGEAQHPGPRPCRRGSLDDVELLEPRTVAMRQKFWGAFSSWLKEHLGPTGLDDCLLSPMLLVKSLEIYGSYEFSAGTPLHYFRQLLAHVQKEFPLVKPFMAPAWAVVTKWELAEPTQHRPPIPEPVVKAMTHRVCCGDGCCFQPSSCAVSTASVVLVKFCVLQGKTF